MSDETTTIQHKSTLVDVDTSGAFKRKPTSFHGTIEAGGPYPPAKGRYILYVSYACPWASRCLALRVAKGLEGVIDVAVTSPVWARTRPDADDHEGWVFDPAYPGATPDPLGLFATVRDIYDVSMRNSGTVFETRYTVPVLFDSESRTIVNNESSEIIRILNSAFDEHAAHPEVDMYPAALRPAIDAMNTRTYEPLCNGVYKCGFARSQQAYDEAVAGVFATIDELEELLRHQRYLAGGAVTEADVRVFCCLVRFDEVYAVHFKCNRRLIRECPNLLGWLRDVYQTLQLEPTVHMKHIKDGYYTLSPHHIVPIGSDFVAQLSVPHSRV
ncbi:Glutathione S-transferase-like protein [Novymonas esmeraldas]|uniref:Glutathione S-transferase-like protein n=1 Tax=Novymonas esmeraldas TaxID=1808958 RepID=A0AAW0ENI8_9TRYP